MPYWMEKETIMPEGTLCEGEVKASDRVLNL